MNYKVKFLHKETFDVFPKIEITHLPMTEYELCEPKVFAQIIHLYRYVVMNYMAYLLHNQKHDKIFSLSVELVYTFCPTAP